MHSNGLEGQGLPTIRTRLVSPARFFKQCRLRLNWHTTYWLSRQKISCPGNLGLFRTLISYMFQQFCSISIDKEIMLS